MDAGERGRLWELFETVKAGVRSGMIRPPEPADVAALGALFEGVRGAVRKSDKALRFFLDVQQGKCYGLFQSHGGGATAMTKQVVSYFRVSTRKQGASGLGIEAQKAAVATFARETGAAVLKEFVEVESGKRADRPELAAALAFAKRAGASLVVAKLDRLARNVAFLSRLMEAGVDFTACDMPHANRFTVHIMAAMAEHEREMISARTKAALAQAKARGTALGSAREGHWEGREEARLEGARKGNERAAKAISRKAREEYADLAPVIRTLREEGKSLRDVAAALNAEGHRTRRGNAFTAVTVQRILERAA